MPGCVPLSWGPAAPVLHQPPMHLHSPSEKRCWCSAALCLFCGHGAANEGPVEKGSVEEEQQGGGGCPLQLQHCDVVGTVNVQH